jgi:hypothetical protein
MIRLANFGGYHSGVVARAADKGAVVVLIACNADSGVERGIVFERNILFGVHLSDSLYKL